MAKRMETVWGTPVAVRVQCAAEGRPKRHHAPVALLDAEGRWRTGSGRGPLFYTHENGVRFMAEWPILPDELACTEHGALVVDWSELDRLRILVQRDGRTRTLRAQPI